MTRRNKYTGSQKVLWLCLFFLCPPQQAVAGSPFLTDDPAFVPQGWEIKFVAVYERSPGQDVLIAPIVDINYTIVEHLKLNLTLAERTLSHHAGPTLTGIADTDFKFKWRFMDEKQGEWVPAISTAPNVTLPTADKGRGLGDGAWRFRLPIQCGKTFGRFYAYAEVGYQWVFQRNSDDQVIYSYATQYQLTQRWNIGAELNGSAPVGEPHTFSAVGNLGLIYVFNDHWQIQGTLGRTLRAASQSGPQFLSQIFIQWNFE